MDIVTAITGASGAPYAQRFIQGLVAAGANVHLVVSPLGRRLLHDELGMETVDLEAQSEHLREQFSRRVELEIGFARRARFATDVPGRLALETQRNGHRRADFTIAQLLERFH